MLKGCFTAHRSTQARKEKMWEEYHKVRTSTKFREMWGHFIGKSLCVAASPTFYQFITDRMFDELIKSDHLGWQKLYLSITNLRRRNGPSICSRICVS